MFNLLVFWLGLITGSRGLGSLLVLAASGRLSSQVVSRNISVFWTNALRFGTLFYGTYRDHSC